METSKVLDAVNLKMADVLFGNGGSPGPGPSPSGKDVLTNGDRFSSLTAVNDALTGGEIYEPQSE